MWSKLARLYKISPYREVALFVVPLSIILVILIMSFVVEGSQQFSELAQAFLRGQLNFLHPIGGAGQDPVFWHGKIYWSEGPFPALLLVPFVAVFSIFHLFFYEGYLQWALVFGVVWFVFRLARLLAYSGEDSLVLAFGFVLGSVFIGVAAEPVSWFFAQVVTTFLSFWGLYEFYTRKRWWLIGVICGLVLMTRASAAPILLFFALELWRAGGKLPSRLTNLVRLGLPVAGAFGLLGLYNFLRFHNPLHDGSGDQLLFPAAAEARSYGAFSLIHVPTNLYSLLLGSPVPVLRDSTSWTLKFPFIRNNVYGMSIFVTSPYLLYLFTQKWSSFAPRARHLLVSVLGSGLFILAFFGLGVVQFGYRYSLDFLPELFLVFMMVYRVEHRRLSRGMKLLLLGAGVVDLYLLWPLIL